MTKDVDDRNPVEVLAEEFVERFRRGERPSVSEYKQRRPDLADQIEELFPALAWMEQAVPANDALLSASKSSAAAASQRALERLGDFRIIREVGRGGMGVVYEAEQESLGRRVALKVLPKSLLADEKLARRFEREARAAARLHHTNIVPVFGVGRDEGLPYYVMQFIDGQGLDAVLVEVRRLREASSGGEGDRITRAPANPVPALVAVRAAAAPADRQSVSALDVAQSMVSGHFTVVAMASDANRSGVGRRGPSAPTEPMSQSCQPDTTVRECLETVGSSGRFTLPGHSDASSKVSSRAAYWHSVARIGVQVAQALQYAHEQGIIHRDIKPANLLLDNQGTVWVTDFGLAKAADQHDLTHTGDVLGTLRYMAPEQFEGRADARTDLHALGLTLYELLALQPAFSEHDRPQLIKQVTGGTPPRLRSLDPLIPRDLETIIHKAIDRDCEHRYATAQELAEDLERYLRDEPIHARRISPGARFARWCKRNPGVASLAVAMLLILSLVAVGSTLAAFRFGKLSEDRGQLLTQANYSRQQAERARAAADDARDQIEQTLRSERAKMAQLELMRGRSLCEDGLIDDGLLWLGRSLATAESAGTIAADWQRVIRKNLGSWCDSACTLESWLAHRSRRGVGAVSADGALIATTAEDKTTRIWDARDGKLLRELQHDVKIITLTFSPDGARLLGRAKQHLRLWNVAGGESVDLPIQAEETIQAALFSSDGRHIAIATPQGVVRCQTETGEIVPELLPHPAPVRALAYSADGRLLLTGDGKQTARLWDVATGAVVGKPMVHADRHSAYISSVAFNPDGTRLVTTGGTARLWDAATQQPIALSHGASADKFAHIAFSPDGKFLATCTREGETGARDVLLWDASTLAPLGQPLRHVWLPKYAAFSPDSRYLASASMSRAQVWDVATSERVGQEVRSANPNGFLNSARYAVAWLAEAQTFLTQEKNGARIWKLPAGNLLRPPITLRNQQPVAGVAFWPQETTLAIVGDGSIKMLEPGQRHLWPPRGFRGRILLAAFSQRGDSWAALVEPLTSNNALLPWELWFARVSKANAFTRTTLLPPYAAVFMAISPDGTRLATFQLGRNCVQVWDVDTAKAIGEPKYCQVPAAAIAFHPTKNLFVTVDALGRVQQYSAQTGEPLGTLIDSVPYTAALAFSANGRVLATGGVSEVRLWDAETGAPIGRVLPHSLSVNALAFAQDDRTVVSGCGDGGVRAWDVATRELLGPCLWHDQTVRSVAASRDGRRILSGSSTACLWKAPLPVEGDAASVRQWVETITGKELLEDGSIRVLDAATWELRRQQAATSSTLVLPTE